ncbi:methyltransferase domain-containing protein [Mucilaginibacter sp.]|uniref:class I SAM-dependent methyltransferase n=1 Tax=Mucilaginibacter sp. TaxID=1882438 RepID=UPI0025FE5CBB|nr:methyltransferase domain-containing protein [Mucilaginibacter sp.]
MKKKLYAIFPFIPKVNLAIGTYLYGLKVKLSAKAVIRELSNQRDLYANVGCGSGGLKGWTNVDLGNHENVTYRFNCSKSIPFGDNSVKGLFTEHFFEHLEYETEVPFFLKDCHRAMQKGGVMRIVVPDAEKYLIGYVQPGWDYLKQTRPLDDDLNDLSMGIKYQTKMQLINEVFRQSGEHKYAWDFETMKLSLLKAGFSEVYKMAFLESKDPVLKIDKEVRKPESLYVEAIK